MFLKNKIKFIGSFIILIIAITGLNLGQVKADPVQLDNLLDYQTSYAEQKAKEAEAAATKDRAADLKLLEEAQKTLDNDQSTTAQKNNARLDFQNLMDKIENKDLKLSTSGAIGAVFKEAKTAINKFYDDKLTEARMNQALAGSLGSSTKDSKAELIKEVPNYVLDGAGDPGIYLARIISMVLIVAGVLAVMMLIIGGLRYIFSGGEDEKIEGAKNHIKWTILGLLAIIFAYFIVQTVISYLNTRLLEAENKTARIERIINEFV